MTPQPVPMYQRPILFSSVSMKKQTYKELSSYRRLFVLFVPHGRDQDQSWRHRSLKATQQHPNRNQRTEVLAHAIHRHTNAPEDDVRTQVLGRRKTLHQVPRRHLTGKITDVEDQGQERKLVGVDMGVLKETHDGGIVD